MYQPQHFSALLPFIAFLSTSNAWLYSTTNVDLSSPPPIYQASSIVNGTVQSNYSTNITSWPCYNYPVPHDVSRVPFPVSGGRYSFTLTNNTVGSLQDFEFIGDIYMGEVSLGDGTYTTIVPEAWLPGGLNNGYYGPDVYVWKDFASGPDCSDPVDVVELVSKALGREELSPRDLVGMNATVGMRIVLFGPNPDLQYYDLADYNYEEMYQCGYITFTDEDLSNDPYAGYCNGGGSPTTGAGASSSTLLTSVIPSATGRPHPSPHPHPIEPLPTPSDFVDVNDSGSHTHTVAVGTGVGVSMGVSILILIIAFVLLRRRRSRKHTGTIGPDIVVGRQQDIELRNGGKDGKGIANGKVVESSASSTHSEPPPPYPAGEERHRGV